MDRHPFDRWLIVAEGAAKVPKLEGGLWHPYRRKWATERKGRSVKDVAGSVGVLESGATRLQPAWETRR
jgi:hypothetical protein